MRKMLLLNAIVAIAAVAVPGLAPAQGKWNFPDRKAIVLDISPHVKIRNFSFQNTLEGRAASSRNEFNYQWKNMSSEPVLAFEIVTLKYDPFDEPMTGSRLMVAGKNSADFTPLMPGESNGDGTLAYGHTHVLTAIAYVRAVRFTDGTLWRADPTIVMAEVSKAAPRIRNAGPLVPEPEAKYSVT
jgi:hypothetical protein